ncbi:MAG: hypothetical protein ACNA8P_01410 [Phycisphaerales bacterium]
MSRMATSDYEIGRPGNRCAVSGRELAVGESFIGALLEVPEVDDLERVDICSAAWEASGALESHIVEVTERRDGEDHRVRRRVFAHWRGVMPESTKKVDPLIGADSLMGIFDSLEGADEARRVAFRYVLALLLVRKRLLVLSGQRPAQGEQPGALLVRRKSDGPDGEAIEVTDPGMDEQAIVDVTEQLQLVLNTESE